MAGGKMRPTKMIMIIGNELMTRCHEFASHPEQRGYGTSLLL